MALYEHVLLARQDVSAQQVEDPCRTVQGHHRGEWRLGSEGGVLGREVARVSHQQEPQGALTSLLNIDAPSAAVLEMERQMRINEDVLRF
jgi:small subunit ribosomal protein S6